VLKEVKPYMSPRDQVALLRRRGMDVDDDAARQWLTSVGYYRLSGYWYPYRQQQPGSQAREDQFTVGASLTDVVALYEFDRKLRTLIHDGIERVEVGVRAALAEQLGASGGPLAYTSPTWFRPSWDHAGWLTRGQSRLARARRNNAAVRHHFENYNGVPVWVLVGVLDFSDISMLYDGLLARDQWAVADTLGITIDLAALSANQRRKALKNHPLARWLEQLTIVRNVTAHHSRLWNRSFTPAATAALRTVPGLNDLPDGQSEDLFGTILMIAKLLEQLSPGSTWHNRVQRLVNVDLTAIGGRHQSEMGFPSDEGNTGGA